MNKLPVVERFFYSLNPEQREDLRVILDAELKDNLVIALSTVRTDGDSIYNDAFEKGYDVGFAKGKEILKEKYQDGHSDGYDEGYEAARAEFEKEQ